MDWSLLPGARRPSPDSCPKGDLSLQVLPAAASRIALWLAGGASVILGAINGHDGLTGSLATRFRVVTFVAALFFVLAGLGFLVLERGLSTIRRFPAGHPGASEMPPELGRAWRKVFCVLALAGGGYFIVVCSAIMTVVSRLRSGVHLFG
jgi:hypothetical protein